MPARWIRCPVSGGLITFKKCLDCAHNYTGQINPATDKTEMCNFRWPYLHYLFTQAEHRKKAGVSATMLTGCMRQAWWNEHREYELDPNKQMAAADGTAWHHLMDEHQEPGTMGEQRLAYLLPSGSMITGQFDRLIPVPLAHQTLEEGPQYWIEDYKHKGDGKIFTQAPDYYVIQLNIYRLMIERGASNVDSGERLRGIVTKLTLLPNSHEKQGKVVNVPLLDLDVLESYLEECLSLWHEATSATPPPRYTESTKSYFCGNYCPHYTACCGVGGEPYDPKMILFEKKVVHKSLGDDLR